MLDFLTAVALLLIIEGIMPFLSPNRLREVTKMIANTSDKIIRIVGFASMLLGMILLYWVR